MSNTTQPNSIRQICLRGFLSGTPRKEIAAQIAEAHPLSRAAAIPTKHIAWHYGDMKKRGMLAAVLKVDTVETPKAAEAVAE